MLVALAMAILSPTSPQQAIAERAARIVEDVCLPFAGVGTDLPRASKNAVALGLSSGGLVAGNHVFTSPDIEVNMMQSGAKRFCYVNLPRTRSLSTADVAPLEKFASARLLKRVAAEGQLRWESPSLIFVAMMDEDDEGNPFVGLSLISK